MQCIFCKRDSSNSQSVEHIIPESLGNTTLTLPRGIVCDDCNNYFSRKVEYPFLESKEIKALRFQESIPNKKGRVPPICGMLLDENASAQLKVLNCFPGTPIYAQGNIIIALDSEQEESPRIPDKGRLIVPAFSDEVIKDMDTTIIARFLAKVAFEALALCLYTHEGGLEYLINEKNLDAIRNYARFGNVKKWQYNVRRIYSSGKLWYESGEKPYQMVHETDFLFIPANDTVNDQYKEVYPYFLLALFGLEFVINIGDSSDDSLKPYEHWLLEHGNISPLYAGKNQKESG